MAGTWEIDIRVLDLPTKRVWITGTRTENSDVKTYSLMSRIDTQDLQKSRKKILNSLKRQHTASVENRLNTNSMVSGWEENLETAMNAWEIE